ncbi:MAG: hypothetical protein ABIR33_13135 [Pyrinomonadaceae bacterium]
MYNRVMIDTHEPKGYNRDEDPLPCLVLEDPDEKDSEEDENTLAKSLIDDIIEETEND